MNADMIDEGMAQVLSREPAPEVAAEFAEDYERLINKLEDPSLKSVARAQAGGPQQRGDRGRARHFAAHH